MMLIFAAASVAAIPFMCLFLGLQTIALGDCVRSGFQERFRIATDLSRYGGINPYGDGNMGQCTWFCWGLFCQRYGFDPGFRGSGQNAAYDAYRHLKG